MFKAVRLNAITYPVEPGERDELARVGAEFGAIEGQRPDEILEAAADCDALLVVAAYVPGSVIDRLDRCRVISRLGRGPTAPTSRRRRAAGSSSPTSRTSA